MGTSTCWSCGKDRALSDALCPHCGKVQPQAPGNAPDKFAILGVPRSYAQELAQVDEAFRALSRKLHPDRFARASPRERRFSLEQTTQLNDAYRVVKDPVRRAEHLLELRGVKLARDDHGGVALPMEFLEQAMEDREQLLEAKLTGGPAAVEALAAGVRGKRDEAMREIAQLLEGAESPAALERASGLLARLRYYLRYLDEALGREPEI